MRKKKWARHSACVVHVVVHEQVRNTHAARSKLSGSKAAWCETRLCNAGEDWFRSKQLATREYTQRLHITTNHRLCAPYETLHYRTLKLQR